MELCVLTADTGQLKEQASPHDNWNISESILHATLHVAPQFTSHVIVA